MLPELNRMALIHGPTDPARMSRADASDVIRKAPDDHSFSACMITATGRARTNNPKLPVITATYQCLVLGRKLDGNLYQDPEPWLRKKIKSGVAPLYLPFNFPNELDYETTCEGS
jgi:hypothetical protein